MGEKESDRRQFPRIRTELLVRYKIIKAPEKHHEAETKDISVGGICLVAREKVIPSAVLALEIRFPRSEEPIVACGRVIWSKPSTLGLSPAGHQRFDNGIEFVEISEADRQRIKEHVETERKNPDKQKEGWKIGIVKDLSNQ
ncbi:MAG: PilZ domain-containing protein [Candidatus Omnitrophica bacterium]|nr:PilZ domain-containing protein [Candidatus Omnitrophota bacterium]